MGKDKKLVVDSVLNPRSVVKIRHATLVTPRSKDENLVVDSVSNPGSVVKIRHAILVIPCGKDENLVARLGPRFGVES